MSIEVRELLEQELPAAKRLSALTFGSHRAPPAPRPPSTAYGAYTTEGELVGTATDLHRHQWWSGRRVPVADVWSVAVLPEARGAGISRSLMAALLAGARRRGAALSTLFPTVAAPYRSCGWEAVGGRLGFEIPTALLSGPRSVSSLTVRAGTDEDRAAAGRLYTDVARSRNGMAARERPPFGPAGFNGRDVDGLTVVEDGAQMVGFASWNRSAGNGPDAVLTVIDLIASSPAAVRELLGVLGSWRPVVGTTRFVSVSSGVVAAELPVEGATRHHYDIWMLRPVEVSAAVAARGWPPALRVSLDLELSDSLAPWNAGPWTLKIAEGEGCLTRCNRAPELSLDVRGFSLLIAGASAATHVRELGLVQGPDDQLATLLALAATPAPESLDFF